MGNPCGKLTNGCQPGGTHGFLLRQLLLGNINHHTLNTTGIMIQRTGHPQPDPPFIPAVKLHDTFFYHPIVLKRFGQLLTFLRVNILI